MSTQNHVCEEGALMLRDRRATDRFRLALHGGLQQTPLEVPPPCRPLHRTHEEGARLLRDRLARVPTRPALHGGLLHPCYEVSPPHYAVVRTPEKGAVPLRGRQASDLTRVALRVLLRPLLEVPPPRRVACRARDETAKRVMMSPARRSLLACFVRVLKPDLLTVCCCEPVRSRPPAPRPPSKRSDQSGPPWWHVLSLSGGPTLLPCYSASP
mmetsp:Transcript_15595/g.42101  ORF Transcript_15595/g.42101 Transcript_15595/m.42101 type:complete len:212 (-) Transcript_15595:333-968(-)